jgi:hypothetical protein
VRFGRRRHEKELEEKPRSPLEMPSRERLERGEERNRQSVPPAGNFGSVGLVKESRGAFGDGGVDVERRYF